MNALDQSSSASLTQETQHCWKTIGVWRQGEAVCEKLKAVIHCRNCDVFTEAGRSLLEREIPPHYTEEWTQILAHKKHDELPGTLSVLVFRIENEWLALPSVLFAEVIDSAKVHSLPHRPPPVLRGLVNVHGEVQLCISLRVLLGIETLATETPITSTSMTSPQRMLVIQHQQQSWVFSVNEIDSVRRLHPSQIQDAPISSQKTGAGFSRGIFAWEDKQVALLDETLVLRQLEHSLK